MRTGVVASAVLFPLTAAAISTVALAQPAPTSNYTSFEASLAKPVQLGYYASAHKDYTPAPLSKIRVVEARKSGMLTVRRGELKTDQVVGLSRAQDATGTGHGGGRWCAIATRLPPDRGTTDC